MQTCIRVRKINNYLGSTINESRYIKQFNMNYIKSIILSCLIIHSFSVFSQTSTVEATLVLDTKDTLRGTVKVWLHLFNKEQINELSFNRRTWFLQGDKFIKIRTKNILSLEFTDFQGKHRFFISDKMLSNFPDKGLLFERIVDGRLSWYKRYSQNSYDFSMVVIDNFFLEGEEPIVLGAFRNTKKNLKELTSDFPELAEDIDDYKTDDDILNIINRFNQLSKNTSQ